MTYTTLISAEDLARNLADPDWAVVDCRFSFNDTHAGRRAYLESHIAGAVYAHLDEDLCGPIVPGQTGRHPLPDPAVLARTLGGWGIDRQVQVVAYDDTAGSMAVRLWWLARWLGHDGVALLDGGWQAWQALGGLVHSGLEARPAREIQPELRADWVVGAEQVERLRTHPDYELVDSRAMERYRGETEPIDPVAGHIPGAVCLPFMDNVDSAGHWRSPAELRQRFSALLGNTPPERVVFYCGSGVTAAHNLLAMAHAGLGDGRLYAGSWSEWINDPRRPVARSSQE
jgi:thiosulfate/3-mercaptopyruvate sulfurtransferase